MIDIGDDGTFELVHFMESNIEIVLPDQGQYAVRLRIKNKNGSCRDYSRTVIAENALPTATIELSTADTIQEGDIGLIISIR